MTIIDLSQPIIDKMPVFPGDTCTSLTQTKFLDSDYHNNHQLQTGMHTGTHIDAPMHLTSSEVYISDWEMESFFGRGCLLDVRSQPVIRMKPVYESSVSENCILLLWTGHDSMYGTASYYEDYPCVDPEFSELMVRKNIKMLGMDAPSPDRYPFPVHKRLLGQGILILENLTNLSSLKDVASFELIALPLKVRADGALARAVARVV